MTDKTDSKEREALIRAITSMCHDMDNDKIIITRREGEGPALRQLLDAMQRELASLAANAGSGPVAWPKDAAEVREFFRTHFISALFAAPDQSPCDSDRYCISAHDFLSAINSWADFPHHPSPPEGMVMVPREPTMAMRIAAKTADMDHTNLSDWMVSDWPEFKRIWDAMLKAAPPTTSAGSGKGE